jgi:CubicO group peptidase (beta-lactamase class C family)
MARMPQLDNPGGSAMGATARLSTLLIGAVVVGGSIVVPAVTAHAAPAVQAYHDASAGFHAQKMSTLPGQGYRPISLSVYDSQDTPKYAAVWVQRSGPAFHVFAGKELADLGNYFASEARAGYYPTILSVTGPSDSGIYAGMTQVYSSSPKPVPAYNMATSSLRRKNSWAARNGYSIRWLAAGGDQYNPLYAAVYWPNPRNVGWDTSIGDSVADFGSKFAAYTSGGMRPDNIIPGPRGYLGTWRDDLIDGWSAFVDMTSAQYQSRFDTETSAGRFPIRVQAYGSGSAARFAAIFTTGDSVYPRTCSASGAANWNLAGFDTYMTDLMTQQSIRAGQLAIVRNGKLLYARGFTCAEAGYEQTQPTSLFRIASTSKALTSIAVHQLIDLGLLKYTDTMQSILNVKRPDGGTPIYSPWYTITVDQLLRHRSGLTQFGGDKVIADASSASLPATPQQWASWAATRPFRFSPDAKYEYNNLNFSLLGQIVAKKRARSYQSAVRAEVFTPLGVSRPRIGGSTFDARAAGEVRYYPKAASYDDWSDTIPMVSKSVMSNPQPIVPSQYGGRNVALGGGAGGWIVAAPDYAKVLAAFDQGANNPLFANDPVGTTKTMWTPYADTDQCRGWYELNLPVPRGGTYPAYWHNGGMEGTATLVARRTDKLSFVMFLDGNISMGPDRVQSLNTIANGVTTWPTTDRFPSVGIPSF